MRLPSSNMANIETARATVSPHPLFLFCTRCVVASVWLYEGLWLKLIARAPHEMAVVRGVVGDASLAPSTLLLVIGAGETLLALGVLSGWFNRPLAWFQIGLLLAMNAGGILFGGNAIREPLGLLVHNAPFLLCIALLGLHGPGALRRSAP